MKTKIVINWSEATADLNKEYQTASEANEAVRGMYAHDAKNLPTETYDKLSYTVKRGSETVYDGRFKVGVGESNPFIKDLFNF